jgi:D-beta-D-heptose 7-phosphate kinase / D-beta-D-heptose 1-phosphate adenosyltransferase
MSQYLFEGLRVLVVGDVMLDRYWSGPTRRISPEAPVPVVQVLGIEERAGGAGNVACNIAALGAQVDLIGLVGTDESADHLEEYLKRCGVACYLSRSKDYTTTVKLRVLSKHQQLIRLDFEKPVQLDDLQIIQRLYQRCLSQADVVILSDYGKGALAQSAELIRMARVLNKPVFVDPKRADLNAYHGATVLTPNQNEFTLMSGCHDEDQLIAEGLKLLNQHELSALLVTRGDRGMTLIHPSHPNGLHLPAHAREVYDVTGAGDTVIAVLALSYAQSKNLETAARLANKAAGFVVGKLGAATVDSDTLQDSSNLLDESSALKLAEHYRAQGQCIVMTGGCFDVLHAGHVDFLKKAGALGDRLIVAINDDASVKRLKGPSRPINRLSQRAAVLAGLRWVDAVVSFSQDTPEHLIRMIAPDIWVKASDYRVEDLPEANTVLAKGGTIKIIDIQEDCSSTSIIEKIRQDE